MTNSNEQSKANKFLLQLIDVKPEEVTLKFFFDNIRNYGIAATVMVAGFYLFRHGAQVNSFPGSGIVFGFVLVLTGLVAYILNFTQAVWALVKLKMRIVPYSIFSMAMFFGTSELLWVYVKQFMQKV